MSRKEKAIIKAYEKGMIYRDLQKKHNVSQHFIRRLVKRSGLSPRQVRPSVVDEESICDDYMAGMPLAKIAKKNNISIERLHGILADNDAERENQKATSRMGGRPGWSIRHKKPETINKQIDTELSIKIINLPPEPSTRIVFQGFELCK